MKKTLLVLSACLLALAIAGPSSANEGEGQMEHAGANIRDLASVQHGAKLFVNYCLSCHSANYMRFHRLSADLGLSEEAVMKNLVFSDAKIGDAMTIAMTPQQGQDWLGKAPPDLSVIARARGADWLYNYLKSFYQDEMGGWNNLMLPNAAMPHVLWQLQGIQKPVYAAHGELRVVDHLELAKPGLQSPEEYAATARDLVAYLEYMSEPSKLKRKSIGIKVLLFLLVFAGLAYALKAEYWRDVH
jgi:ubiquinol-cytochrome c reductase cytochrome c1 subunit